MQAETGQMHPKSGHDAEPNLLDCSAFNGIDGRTSFAHRLREISANYFEDLGDAGLSGAARTLVYRAAFLTAELERMEAQLSKSERSDPRALEAYTRSLGNLRRFLAALGLNKQKAA